MSTFLGALLFFYSSFVTAEVSVLDSAQWTQFMSRHDERANLELLELSDEDALQLEPAFMAVLQKGRIRSFEFYTVGRYIAHWLVEMPRNSEKERLARRWISRAEERAEPSWRKEFLSLLGPYERQGLTARRILAAFIWMDDFEVQQAFVKFALREIRSESHLARTSLSELMRRWALRTHYSRLLKTLPKDLAPESVFTFLRMLDELQSVNWKENAVHLVQSKVRSIQLDFSLWIRRNLDFSTTLAFATSIMHLSAALMLSNSVVAHQASAYLAAFVINKGIERDSATRNPSLLLADRWSRDDMALAGTALLTFIFIMHDSARDERLREPFEKFILQGAGTRLFLNPGFIVKLTDNLLNEVRKSSSPALLEWRKRASLSVIRAAEQGTFSNPKSLTHAASRLALLETEEGLEAIERWIAAPEHYALSFISSSQSRANVIQSLTIFREMILLSVGERFQTSQMAWAACVDAFKKSSDLN